MQLRTSANKAQNIKRCRDLVSQAAKEGADIVVLPECWNSPYGTEHFKEHAEPMAGTTCKVLSEMATSHNIYLVGGSFPEVLHQDGKSTYFNTCTVWDRSGKLIGTHRKLHLFDIDLPGKITFQESKVLSAGNSITSVVTEYGKLGIGICYDMRFPELAMIAARKGCIAMIYPGAFNLVTGPLHWELLLRARAIDNQFFVSACSPARDVNSSYVAWGNSTIVDPMGIVLATTDHNEGIVTSIIDLKAIENARLGIPVNSQRRFDLYPDVSQ